MANIENLIECGNCENIAPYGDSVITQRASRFEPADGFDVCVDCVEEMESAAEAAAEARAEWRADRMRDGGDW